MSRGYPKFETIAELRGEGSLYRDETKLAEVSYEIEIMKRQQVTEMPGRRAQISDVQPEGRGYFSVIETYAGFSDGETLVLRLEDGKDAEIRILNKVPLERVTFAVARPVSLLG